MHDMPTAVTVQLPAFGTVINSQDIPNGLLPANTVFIDKGSPWENPFTIGIHGDRDQVCDRFDLLLAHSPEVLQEIDALKGKNLIVLNANERSHADTLIKLAAMNYRARLSWAEETKHRLTDKLGMRPAKAA